MRLGGQKRVTPVVKSQVYNVNLHDILKKEIISAKSDIRHV